MKISYPCIGMLAGLLSMWTIAAYEFTYDAGDIKGSKSSTGITYTLNVSKSNLGTSYNFDTKADVTSGSPPGIDINVSSGGATGTIEYTNDSLPTSNFPISMNGKLIPPSGGDGSQPTWGASGNAKTPLVVTPKEDGGLTKTFYAYTGSTPVYANWSISTGGNVSSSSGYFTVASSDIPNDYIVTATYNGDSAEAKFTRLKVQFMDQNNIEISSVKVVKGGAAYIKAQLQPTSAENKYGVGTITRGTGISCNGSVSGTLTVSVSSNASNGGIDAKVGSDIVGTVGVEVVEAKIELIIVP